MAMGTFMLAMAVMYQDLKARSTRRAEELGGENGDEKEESSRDDYSPHWQAYVDLLPTNVDSLLLWSTEELAFLQNSRIGERAKRRKRPPSSQHTPWRSVPPRPS